MRWTGIVALGLVAVIVAVYVAKGVIGTVQVGGAKDDARESVGQLARDTGDVNQQVASNRETLGTPLQSWSQVVCELTSNDAGWIVQSWEQGCSHEQVDVYSAGDFDRAESLRDVDPRVDVMDWSDEPARPPLLAQDVRRLWLHLGEPADVGRAGDLADEDHTLVTVSGPGAETDLGCSPGGSSSARSPSTARSCPSDSTCSTPWTCLRASVTNGK